MSLKQQLPKAVKELRLHLCQTSPASAGVRQFIQASYADLKQANPDLKVLIREAQGVSPRAFVRFAVALKLAVREMQGGKEEAFTGWDILPERGVEQQAPLDDLSAQDVASALSKLTNQ